VHKYEWVASHAFTEIGEAHAFGDFGAVDLEGVAIGRRGLWGTRGGHAVSSCGDESIVSKGR